MVAWIIVIATAALAVLQFLRLDPNAGYAAAATQALGFALTSSLLGLVLASVKSGLFRLFGHPSEFGEDWFAMWGLVLVIALAAQLGH